MRSIRSYILIAIAWLLPFSVEATVFKNAYVSFELPTKWSCHLEGTEWVCSSQLSTNSREAIIILTAKEVGPSDTFEAYEQHLKNPRTNPGPKGKPVKAQVKHVKRSQIAGHVWVDSLHLGSEIPGYYTRYMATIKDRLAILVTFSAHQRQYTKYSGDFMRAIMSLKVVANKEMWKTTPLADPSLPGTGGGTIGQIPGGSDFPPGECDPSSPDCLPPEPSGRGNAMKFLGLALLIAAIGAYLFLKKRK